MSAARPAALPDRLKDYVFVNERVAQFHDRYPDGRIVTEMSVINETMVAFKALVFRNPEDAEPAATGHALDTIDVKQSSFEKTETASVGRALAFLNFSVKRSIASREEIEKHERHQRQATGDRPASDEQKQGILNLLEQKRPGDRRAQQKLFVEASGKDSRDDLTDLEARNLIKKLQGQG